MASAASNCILKILLAILICLWLGLGRMAIQPFGSSHVLSYRTTIERNGTMIYESPPMQLSKQEERQIWIKAKIIICSLLAADTVGIALVVWRLRIDVKGRKLDSDNIC